MSGKPRGRKVELFTWVDDQQQLDLRTKFILRELAGYADGDCVAWAKVETLAYSANCTERTVQSHLAALKEAGLIVDTGRTHRLEGSTRSVPLYQLAPEVEGLGRARSMGEISSPIAAAWVKPGLSMGEEGLHPQGQQGHQELADASSPGARGPSARDLGAGDLGAVFEALVEVAPRSVLKFFDRGAAEAAFAGLAEAGLDVAGLPGCMRRMAADPAFRSRKFPPPLHEWLVKQQFMGWWPEAGEPAAGEAGRVEALPIGAAGPEDQALWRVALAAAQATLRSGDFLNYLAPAMLGHGPGGLVVVARTGIGRDALKACLAQVRAAWAAADPQGRPLGLVSKAEFEAGMVRQSEGVA